MSLRELSSFCEEALGPGPAINAVTETRRYDIPYFVTDARVAEESWSWQPEETREQTLQAIAGWARDHRAVIESLAVAG